MNVITPEVPTTSLVNRIKITLTSAQILALNTTPVTLVAAPGNGKFINVLSAVAKLNYNTTAYSNVAVNLGLVGTTQNLRTCTSFLDETATVRRNMTDATSSTGDQIPTNAALQIRSVADPTTGDSTVTFWVTYEIVTE